MRVLALHEVEVAVAQARRLGSDQDLAGTWRADLDVFDVKLSGDLPKYRCPHFSLLFADGRSGRPGGGTTPG
jgi:hypothetical protein